MTEREPFHVASMAERRCSRCGEFVLVVYAREALRPVLFDRDEKSILTPGDDGVWSLLRAKVEHECELVLEVSGEEVTDG